MKANMKIFSCCDFVKEAERKYYWYCTDRNHCGFGRINSRIGSYLSNHFWPGSKSVPESTSSKKRPPAFDCDTDEADTFKVKKKA
jgi:hypothetical protein